MVNRPELIEKILLQMDEITFEELDTTIKSLKEKDEIKINSIELTYNDENNFYINDDNYSTFLHTNRTSVLNLFKKKEVKPEMWRAA